MRPNNPVFKALLWATIIEVVALIITVLPVLRSFMSHAAADPNSASNNMLAQLGIYFHYPSFLILTLAPFDAFLFAPLIQVLLMTAVLYLILRLRNRGKSL